MPPIPSYEAVVQSISLYTRDKQTSRARKVADASLKLDREACEQASLMMPLWHPLALRAQGLWLICVWRQDWVRGRGSRRARAVLTLPTGCVVMDDLRIDRLAAESRPELQPHHVLEQGGAP